MMRRTDKRRASIETELKEISSSYQPPYEEDMNHFRTHRHKNANPRASSRTSMDI